MELDFLKTLMQLLCLEEANFENDEAFFTGTLKIDHQNYSGALLPFFYTAFSYSHFFFLYAKHTAHHACICNIMQKIPV